MAPVLSKTVLCLNHDLLLTSTLLNPASALLPLMDPEANVSSD